MVRLLENNQKIVPFLALIFILISQTTLAATETTQISWAMLIFGLMGGLALFLYGMELISEGMKKNFGLLQLKRLNNSK